ncbi:MAG: IS200/IS605 family transposase, partial [Candidatus Heimdallarchaeota archaeon]|nr:IS200/IS605 family transposase [Candidatus Heimdallarchaeota archaeon]
MKYKKQSHVVYYTVYHLVILMKYCRKVLKSGMGDYLKKRVMQVGRFHPEIEIKEINVDKDHIHVMVSIPPKMSVSEVVQKIKCNTEKAMRDRFPFLNKVYWGVNGICAGKRSLNFRKCYGRKSVVV